MKTAASIVVEWAAKTKKLTAASFVKVWQSSNNYDEMVETLSDAARKELADDLIHAHGQLDRLSQNLAAFNRKDINYLEHRSRHAVRILSGEKIWLSTWGSDYRFRSLLPDNVKPTGFKDFLCPPEFYAQHLEQEIERAQAKVDELKTYVCNPLAQRHPWVDSYVPTAHSLLCRSKIFRKKGVKLKQMKGLDYDRDSGSSADSWEDLQDIACEFA